MSTPATPPPTTPTPAANWRTDTFLGRGVENVRRISGHGTRIFTLVVVAIIGIGFMPEPMKNIGYVLALAPWIGMLVAFRFYGDVAWAALAALFIDLDKLNLPEGSTLNEIRNFVGNMGEKTQETLRSLVLWTAALVTVSATVITFLPTQNHPLAYFVGLLLCPIGGASILAASSKSEGKAARVFGGIGIALMAIFVLTLGGLFVERIWTEPALAKATGWVKDRLSPGGGDTFTPTTFVRPKTDKERKNPLLGAGSERKATITEISKDPHGRVVGFTVVWPSGVVDHFLPDYGKGRKRIRAGRADTGSWGFEGGVVTDDTGKTFQVGWEDESSPEDEVSSGKGKGAPEKSRRSTFRIEAGT